MNYKNNKKFNGKTDNRNNKTATFGMLSVKAGFRYARAETSWHVSGRRG